MSDLQHGTIDTDGVGLAYLAAGSGPLALCVHGFREAPWTYRQLLPELAAAGYRAVAPLHRGLAPADLPPGRHHVHTSVLVADIVALHGALGGGQDAVLVTHDWSAVAAWALLGGAPAGGGVAEGAVAHAGATT